MYEEVGNDPRASKRWGGSAEVHARGRVFKEVREYAIGDPWSPATRLSDEALQRKFHKFTSGILAEEQIRAM